MKRLLLIEDDPAFGAVLARTLRRRGLRVALADSAEAALDLLAAAVPDYAVVDMKLGTASGLALIPALRAASAAMRIVVLTGYASIPTTVEAIKRGADDYLAKPVDVDSLLAALEGTGGVAPEAAPMSLRRLEWEHIQRVLDEHGGNISATAKALGMHRRTLQRRLGKRPVRS